MDHRLPKVGAAISIVLAIGAFITFVFLNQKFEGPDATNVVRSPYELTARFANSKTLPSKQPVLHKGVSVGRVRSVDWDPKAQESVVTFTIDEQLEPIYRDAVLQIGERSLLGDAYLNLVSPGTEGAGEIESGGEVARTLKPINFDEALDFLDEDGRDRVRNLIDTVAEGMAREGNGGRLNATVGGVAQTVHELRLLTNQLKGQEQEIADLVSDAGTVLDTLGARESAIRTIVSSGRAALEGLGSNTESLGQGIDELPRLLETGQATLGDVRPLLEEARPLVAKLREIAPDLTPAFAEGAPFSIGPLSRDLIKVIEGLEPQRKVAEKVLPEVNKLNEALLPLTIGTGPAARNLVPVADYLAPRAESIGAFYSLGASVTAHGDESSRYARFFLSLDALDAPSSAYSPTGTCTGSGEQFCFNAYPEPRDALDNQPFTGEYPQLLPYKPPSRKSVLKR